MTTTLPQLPFDRPGVLDIAPLYAELRERAPVTAVRTATGDPAWLVTGYAECRALFADPRLGRSHPDPANASRVSGSAILGGPMMGDPETEHAQHQIMRKLLAPAFSARRMQRLRGHVDALVAAALDDLQAHGSPADLHELVSLPIPILVICELLGVPYADRNRFRAWSEGAGRLDDPAFAQKSLYALVQYVQGLIERKRAEPGEDVLTDLAAAGPEHDGRSAGLAAALLFAGHETTVTRIDVGTLLLLRQQRWEPAGSEVVEEILRLAAPGGSGLPRYAHADVEIAGVTIRQGDCVVLAPAAANRDPSTFAAPEAFDPGRDTAHLSFGYGPRFCIGASLARVELQAVFTALPARFPTLQVVPGELRLRADLLTGGLDALPVTW
ncbi:cytochrome P450 [Pseudonocardia sp. WMMC193]|uniref:cytochrome P450 n=1 Tax=Pseudonocardia sp. WMMC193 TaxID=2911965 RepID=UPI001F3C37C0|nr:cytochrome P450 [Pseudonocardia sp. WMMC193]MCF7551732.1 cytochrome P450 [Pseudonocardia sp. WMMC193]